jgi:hypothetical protein
LCGSAAIFSSVPHMLKQLLSLVQDVHARSGCALRRAVGRGQRAQLQALLTGKEWTSADGMHVIYQMLTALPWPARAAPDTLLQAMPLSAWLGALVDAAAFQRRTVAASLTTSSRGHRGPRHHVGIALDQGAGAHAPGRS